MARAGFFESMRASQSSEQQDALDFLFPSKNRFERLQMLGDNQPRAITPLNMLGVFRRLYKSKVLSIYQEEHGYNRIAGERKGRLEGSEIVAARRINAEKKEDE
jgi:hypothetical protein